MSEALDALSSAIAAYSADPTSAAAWQDIVVTRRAAAEAVALLPKRAARGEEADRVLKVIQLLLVSGAQDYPLELQDRETLCGLRGGHWPELLSAMVLTSGWHWPDAPLLSAVPEWLWGEYTAWLFAAPEGFTVVGDADRYAAHVLRHLAELAKQVERNTGSATVRSAGKAWLRVSSGIPLYFSRGDLRRHAELRGRILMRLQGREVGSFDPLAFSREGRRLRVGFLNRHFGPQTETYTTLPTFEHLDPERFEVVLFSVHPNNSPLERFCRSRGKEFNVLPADLEGQLSQLRSANLDVLVFGTNVTAVCHEVTRLALYRSAPLQVVNNSSCITSGLPHIDLYVSGTLTETVEAAAQFSERLGLLPGPAHAFDYEQDRQAPTGAWTRASLEFPEDAVVFVSAANYFKIIPEMRHAWAKLLAAVPGSRLLLHPFNPNWTSSYPIDRFRADFDRVLDAHGVDRKRVVISSAKFPSRADVKELLRIGDIYLDTFPFGGVNSLVDPLEIGIPVIAWEGDNFRSRMGAALLRSLGLDALVAKDFETYHALAIGLAGDAERRNVWRTRIADVMGAAPLFLDALAASDAFGALIETAFDELTTRGRDKFRQAKNPILVPANTPLDATSRQLHARGLSAAGRHTRAVEYLVAAVTNNPDDANAWFDLATALQRTQQAAQAVQALETSLRLDGARIEGWRLMAELAERAGAGDIARQAHEVIQQLAPADSEIAMPDFAPAHLRLAN